MTRAQGAMGAQRRSTFSCSGKAVLGLVDGCGLRLVGEGYLGQKPRGKKKMESSGKCNHFMLAGAEYNMDTVRKEDGEIGRRQIMKACRLW